MGGRPRLEYRDAWNMRLWSGHTAAVPIAWRTKDDPSTDESSQDSLRLGHSWAPPGEHNTYVWCGADWGWAHAKPIVLQENQPRVWQVSVAGNDYAAIRASINGAQAAEAAELQALHPALDPNRGHGADLVTLGDETVACPRCGAESMDLDLLAEVACDGHD